MYVYGKFNKNMASLYIHNFTPSYLTNRRKELRCF